MGSEEQDARALAQARTAGTVFAVLALALIATFTWSESPLLRTVVATATLGSGMWLMFATFWVMVLQAERKHKRKKRG